MLVTQILGNLNRVQPNLFISKIGQLLLPRFCPDFETQIVETVKLAYLTRNQAGCFIVEAEQTLFRALGLENWQPPEPCDRVTPSQRRD